MIFRCLVFTCMFMHFSVHSRLPVAKVFGVASVTTHTAIIITLLCTCRGASGDAQHVPKDLSTKCLKGDYIYIYIIWHQQCPQKQQQQQSPNKGNSCWVTSCSLASLLFLELSALEFEDIFGTHPDQYARFAVSPNAPLYMNRYGWSWYKCGIDGDL